MKKVITYTLLVVFVFSSCKKASERKCWKKKGDVISQVRELPSFQHLHLSGGLVYNLIQDSLDYVELRGGENLIDFIETKVEDNVLTIRDDNNCNFLRKLPNTSEVDIHFTALNSVHNISHNRIVGSIHSPTGFFYWNNWDGASNIDVALECDSVQIALHTGSPTFKVSGTANVGYLYAAGNGQADGTEFVMINGQAHNVGLGDIRIRVEGGMLNCVLASGGNIYYTGNPEELLMSDEGVGNIISF